MPDALVLETSCRACRGVFPSEGVIRMGEGHHICFECVSALYSACSSCQELTSTGNGNVIQGEVYCERCTRESFKVCFSCSRLKRITNMEYDHGNTYVCHDCMPSFIRCASSGLLINRDYAVERGGLFYHPDHIPVRHKIHKYNYKPQHVNFLGEDSANRLFFGVELEIENGGRDPVKCDTLMGVVNPSDGEADSIMYGKNDGSVEEGFEMVTHPASFDYHMNVLPWEKLCKKAIELGYSRSPTTCGLHVHISRRYFGQSLERQDVGTMKVLYLVEKFWDELLVFSRRTEEQIDRWASRYGMRDNPRDILNYAKSGQGKYKAVNLEYSHTLEFRLFRGTLDYKIVLATIQLCYVLATMSKELSVQDMIRTTWEDIITRAKKHDLLIEYLHMLELVESPVIA